MNGDADGDGAVCAGAGDEDVAAPGSLATVDNAGAGDAAAGGSAWLSALVNENPRPTIAVTMSPTPPMILFTGRW